MRSDGHRGRNGHPFLIDDSILNTAGIIMIAPHLKFHQNT